jgi:16S rRNA (cytosine967-C5)-methyltransferase
LRWQYSAWHYYGVKVQKPREIAVCVLEEYAQGQGFLEQILDQWFGRTELSAADRGLLHELCNGVVRWQGTLDWLIRQRARNWPPKLRVQILLRLGLYQTFWLDRIPDHAAVNETVTLAKRMQCLAQSGFINAVLRNSLRERETITAQLQDLKERDPATGYSHPAWLAAR